MRAATLRHQAGMSLVEVLLVIFIMGLVAGVAVITLPERDTPQERAVKSLRAAIQGAHDRAVLTGEVIGLRTGEAGIEVLSWSGTEWMPAGRNHISLPRDVRLAIIRDRPGPARPEAQEDFLVFNPLGVTEPVRLDITRGAFTLPLQLTPEGELIDATRS